MPPKNREGGFNLDKFKVSSWSQMWKELRLGESYTSLVLGLIVIVVVAVIAAAFIKGKSTSTPANQEVSSDKTESTQEQKSEGTYVVVEGESLWDIAEKKYNSGYKWVDIARANNLENPDIIEPGTKLTLPTVKKESETNTKQQQQLTEEVTPTLPPQVQQQKTVQQGEKITGNTYTVKSGDFLWDIAVRAYGDGYKWVDIARANNLENPDIIFSENVLKIPR